MANARPTAEIRGKSAGNHLALLQGIQPCQNSPLMSSNYENLLSVVDERLQATERTPSSSPDGKPWGANTPSRDEISRSLSMPILTSVVAQVARQDMAQRVSSRSPPPHPQRPKQGPVTAKHGTRAPLASSSTGPGGKRPSTASGARPSSASAAPKHATPSHHRATPSRPSTAAAAASAGRGRKGTLPIPPNHRKDGESFTAMQLKTLEAEMAHLRATIDVLLEAKGMEGAGGSGSPGGGGARPLPPVFQRGGGSPGATSGLRVGEGSLSSLPPLQGIEAAGRLAYALHTENMALASVVETMDERRVHESKVAALVREGAALRAPSTLAAAQRPDYTRDDVDQLMEATPATGPPVLLPPPSEPPPQGLRERRASLHSRRGSVMQPDSGAAALANAVNASASSASSASFPYSVSATLSAAAAAVSSSNAITSASVSFGGGAPMPRPSTAPVTGGGGRRPSLSTSNLSSSPTAASASAAAAAAAAAAKGGVPSSMTATLTGAASRGSSTSPTALANLTASLPPGSPRSQSAAALAATYSGPPGSVKKVAATTQGRSFSFTTTPKPHKSLRDGPPELPPGTVDPGEDVGQLTRKFVGMGYSIGEAKVWADIELARAREAKELAFKFKAQPIAPATADLGLFQRIMKRNEDRRALEHERKAAYAAAHFKPFDIVNGHCAEAEARGAARRAKEELETKRELEECTKFTANPLNAKAMVPKGLVLVPVTRKVKVVEVKLAKEKEVWIEEEVKCWMPTREVGRKERVAAEARASAARASLPARMALAVDELKRKQSERAARLAEEEARDRVEHTFHPTPHPDFAAKQERFLAACAASRVAVTSAFHASIAKPFSFDTLEAKAKQDANKDKVIKEFEFQTSRAMAVRRRSVAYEKEGADLVGDRPHTAGGRFSGGKKGTLGVNPLLEATAALGHTKKLNSSSSASSSSGGPHGSLGESLHASSAPPAAMTKSVKLKLAEVQKKLRAMQEAELEREKADERYHDTDRGASRKLGPTFAALERERLTKYDEQGNAIGVTQLSWYMDRVTATASENAQYFRKSSQQRAASLRSLVDSAQKDRPLVMQRATLEHAKDKARKEAMVRVAKISASAENSAYLEGGDHLHLSSTHPGGGGGGGGGQWGG